MMVDHPQDKLRFVSRSDAARHFRALGHADAWSIVDRLWRDGGIEIGSIPPTVYDDVFIPDPQ